METMKTDKNKTPPPAPPKREAHPMVAELAAMEGLPVQTLLFEKHPGPDLRLPDVNGGSLACQATPEREIVYLPKVQLFRIVQRSRDPKTKTRTLYVPREWATFEPLE